jgi:hypothetical protein
MNKLLTLIFLFASLDCRAQIPADFPVIDKTDLPEAKFLPARHFTGESLFGYMDGGAELYREYGISDAVITELDLGSGHYKCEVFKMTGPEEAFGIYSVSKYRCLNSPPISPFTCQTHYQMQICKGPYYISIINKSGNKADSVNSLKIGMLLAEKIIEPSADLSAFIPDANPDDLRNNAILAKGKLGLMNGATEWEDYFTDITGYYTLIIRAKEKSLLSVRFSKPEDFQQFLKLHGWGTCDLSVNGVRMLGGEIIRLLSENQLLIEIAN